MPLDKVYHLPRLAVVFIVVFSEVIPCGALTLEKSYSAAATRLRRALLEADYDPVVPPTSDRVVNYSKAGTDVGMNIRFFKVEGVDSSKGHMRLKVWVRLRWVDQRLRWNPEDYDNITEVSFFSGGSTDKENSEIWLPDIQLYNSKVGLQHSLDKTMATVYSDGSIFWSRPGLLDTMCKFSGLVAFPFDSLKCGLEWGGWAYSDGFQGIGLTGEGYAFLTTEDSAGSSYQEYSIQSVHAEAKTNFYLGLEHPWTILKYTVVLGRATAYYIVLIIVPTVLLTYTSFGAFFMSHLVGERLGFGITLLLVMEVMRSSVNTFVPVCGEVLWVDLFMVTNTIFCYLSVIETILILFLAFQTEHWSPKWPAFLARLGQGRLQMPFQSEAGNIYRRLSGVLPSNRTRKNSMSKIAQSELTDTDTGKLIFFENIFYLLDSDSSGLISLEHACCMLSYVDLAMSRMALEEFMEEHWPGHRRFNCSDFLEVCVELLWMKPFEEIKMGVENYTSSYTRHTRLCAKYWLTWSMTIDRWSRFWFPMLYTCTLVVLANIELSDDYYNQQSSEGMFQGIGHVSMHGVGVLISLITPFLCVLTILFWIYLRRSAKNHALAQINPSEENVRPVVPRWSVADDIENGPGNHGNQGNTDPRISYRKRSLS